MRKGLFNEQRDEILKILSDDVGELDPKGRDERVRNGETDFFGFCKTYLPHYTTFDFAPFHRELFEALERRERVARPVVRAAPRGFGKSAVASFLYVVWSVVYRRRNFIVIVSANDDLAADLTEFIKIEFEANRRIRRDFGEMLTDRGEAGDFTANGVRVLSRGKKQMVRGFKHRNYRPDLIVLDDLEKDKEASSPDIVKETLKVIVEGLYPAMAQNATLFIIGTVIRKKSVLGTILYSGEKPYCDWDRKVYRALTAVDGKTVSLWPAYWPVPVLERIRENMGTVAFEKEYQNNPLDDEDALFKEEWIRYFHESDFPYSELEAVMFVDAAAKGQKRHDFKAIVTVGFHRGRMKYPVLHCRIRRESVWRMMRATFRLYEEFRGLGVRVKAVGVEENGFQTLLKDLYDTVAKEFGYYLPLTMVNQRAAKEDRVESIGHLVERGHLMFRRDSEDDTGRLIEQLLYFPSNSVHDDGPDALASAVKLLERQSAKTRFYAGRRRESARILAGFDK